MSLQSDGYPAFHTVSTISTRMRPITLQGDILAVSDDVADGVIQNLKDGTCAALRNDSGFGETALTVIDSSLAASG